MIGLGKDRNPRQWALDLQAREERGENIGIAAKAMWRQALGLRARVSPEPADDVDHEGGIDARAAS